MLDANRMSSLMYSFNRGNIEGTKSLRKFVFDGFCVCVGTGFVD